MLGDVDHVNQSFAVGKKVLTLAENRARSVQRDNSSN
jgi:hypothetical protein